MDVFDIKLLPHRIGIALNSTVVPILERRPCAPRPAEPNHPIVFILGPPRCGSTFLVQTLVSNLDISYMSNRHAAWFGAPWFVERFARPRRPDAHDEHRSTHGVTSDPGGPSECGAWWRRFHPGDLWEDPELASCDVDGFGRSLRLFSLAAGRPLLFKNLYASFRIPAIVKAIPNAAFIDLHRSEDAVARSILKTRQDTLGSLEAWWSMKPRGWESAAALSPEGQVRWQIAGVDRHIREGLAAAAIPDQRVLRIDYQLLCDDPRAVVDQVSQFISSLKEEMRDLGA